MEYEYKAQTFGPTSGDVETSALINAGALGGWELAAVAVGAKTFIVWKRPKAEEPALLGGKEVPIG